MIIWRGFGILIAIVGILTLVVSQLSLEAWVAHDTLETYKKWFAFGNFALTAAVLYALALLLEKFDKPRVVIDKETGREIALRRGDSLFFVPARFWPYLVLIFGVICLFQS